MDIKFINNETAEVKTYRFSGCSCGMKRPSSEWVEISKLSDKELNDIIDKVRDFKNSLSHYVVNIDGEVIDTNEIRIEELV